MLPRFMWGASCSPLLLISLVTCFTLTGSIGISWDWGKWWTYTGISGPKFWGLINPEWRLCTHGRRQSPVDLQPRLLLHDPNLGPLHVDKTLVGKVFGVDIDGHFTLTNTSMVSGRLTNTGHSVIFVLDTASDSSQQGAYSGQGSGRNGSDHSAPYSTDIHGALDHRRGGPSSDKYNSYDLSGRGADVEEGGDTMRLFDRMDGGMGDDDRERRRGGGGFGEGQEDREGGVGGQRRQKSASINISGGPLSYRYQISHVQFHFGTGDGPGSEHTINGTAFRAEMQVYGFNVQLYKNFTDAITRPHGAMAVSVLLQVGDTGHSGLSPILDALPRVRWAGEEAPVSPLSVSALLPPTHHYLTYEGSLTQPPCHETVTWILANKPVYVTKRQLGGLQQLQQGRRGHPQARLLSNYRPTQRLYHRTLRTNIDFNSPGGENDCGHRPRTTFYKAANTQR